MGGLLSTPGSDRPSEVLNFILREMFRRSDLMDIYSLADKSRCSHYIIAGADALESLFVKIRIHPERGQDGTYLFQSLHGLKHGMPQNMKDKQREYCMELSFFFIRIFQIFGALSLSMFDSSLPLTDPTDEVLKERTKQGSFVNPNTFLGFTQAAQPEDFWTGFKKFVGFGGSLSGGGGPLSGGSLSGGSLDPRDDKFYIRKDPYKILNFHISRPDGGGVSATPMKFDGFPMYLDQNGLYDFREVDGGVVPESRRVKSDPKPSIQYSFMRNSNQYSITATLIIEETDPYKVSLIDYKNDTLRFKEPTLEETLTSFGGGAPTSQGSAYPETKGKTLPNVLKAMFEAAANSALGPVKFSVVKLLRSMRYLSGSDNSDGNITGTHVSIPGGQDNSDAPRIIFTDSAQIGEGRRRVRITGALQIEEPRPDVLKGTFTYIVKVDFSNSEPDPSELKGNMKQYRTANFVAYSANSLPKHDKNDMTIPQYIESVFQDIIKGGSNSNSEKGVDYTKGPYNSDAIPDDLRIKKLWKALAKDPPVKSHCVARAAQLLSVDAIKGNMTPQAFSSVCRLGFAYQKDGSLPPAKAPISDSTALHTLATLFFTDLHKQMPKIQDEGKYKEFLQFMQKTMVGEGTPGKMSNIREQVPTLCGERGDTRLEIPRPLAQELRSVANQLLAQQVAHVNAGMEIIGQLFDMDAVINKKEFGLNPAIIRGGMPEVERVAGLARGLLMEYYKGCESTYRDGIQLIYNADKSTPLVGRKADGTQVVPAATAPAPKPTAPKPQT